MMKDTAIRRRVLIGTASNFIGKAVALVTFFFLTPFILHRLGDASYGLWVLVGSIVGYGSLLDLGLWGSIIKYVAEHRARGEHEQVRQVVLSAFYLYLLLGLVVIGISALAAPFIPGLFNISPAQKTAATGLVVLMGAGVGISLPALTPLSVLRGLQRYDIVNFIEVIATLFSAAGVVLALLLGAGVFGIVVVNLCGMLVMSGLGAWFLARIAPELKGGPLFVRPKRIRAVLTYSWPLFVREAADQFKHKTAEITIGAFMPLIAITPYNLARRLSETTHMLTKQFMKVLLPLASELDAERDSTRLRLVYTAGTRLTLAISVILAAVLIALARPFLTVWVGPEYADAAPLVGLLAIAAVVTTTQWPAGAVLQGMARHRILAATSLCAGLASLALSIALIGPLGLTGVALGALIPTVVEFAVVIPVAMSIIGVGAKKALREIVLPVLGPGAAAVISLFLLKQAIVPASLASIAVIAGAGIAVFALSYLQLGASTEERKVYFGLASGLIRLSRSPTRATAARLVELMLEPQITEKEEVGT